MSVVLHHQISSCDSPDLSDEELVQRARLEFPYKTASYEELLRRYQYNLKRFCFAYLHDAEEANDACQDIMLRTFNALPRFEGRCEFKVWLMKVAANVCASYYANRLRLQNWLVHFGDDVPEQGVEYNMDNDIQNFYKLIIGLSLRERKIMSLRFVAGLQLSEIAELLGQNLSTIKMCYYRALAKMKQKSNSKSLIQKQIPDRYAALRLAQAGMYGSANMNGG